jgi:hypothetical protein
LKLSFNNNTACRRLSSAAISLSCNQLTQQAVALCNHLPPFLLIVSPDAVCGAGQQYHLAHLPLNLF